MTAVPAEPQPQSPAAPQQPLPPEISAERLLPDGARYDLPRRPLGAARWFAVVPLVFSLMAIGFAWNWFAFQGQLPVQPMSLAFMAFGLLIIGPAAILPIALSAMMVWGRASIEIGDGRLRSIERVGPFRWSHKIALSQIRRLLVTAAGRSGGPGSAESVPLESASTIARFAAIRIERVQGKPRMAAIGYPRAWLLPLAEELARQAATAPPDPFQPPASSAAIQVANAIEVADDQAPAERLEQPAGSRILVEENPGSLTFQIPPAGIRGSAGLFIFSCIWLAFMAACTTFVIIGSINNVQNNVRLTGLMLMSVFVGVFWLIGIAVMLAALHMARRRAAIAVAGGQCLVIQIGLFGEKKKVWNAEELTAVKVGARGIEVNDRPVMELQFIPRDGKKYGILSGRDLPELEWLATRLSGALGLMAPRAGGVLEDVGTQPADSDVVCQQSPNTLTMSIPRRAWRKGPLGWWIGTMLWNIVVIVVAITAVSRWNNDGQSLFWVGFLGAWTLSGIGLTCLVIHFALQRAEIAVAERQLLVLRYGIFGERRNEWSAADLAAIRAGPSGMTVNGQRLMQLQIVSNDGKILGALTGRNERELAWIATLLRQRLDLPAEPAK